VNCAETEIMLHALLDDALDAGHARHVEVHLADCADCEEKLDAFRAMRTAIANANLKERAPASLRAKIEAALPEPSARVIPLSKFSRPARRTFFGGFAMGSLTSAAIAATLALAVFRADVDRGVADDVVSAHIRSLQAGHLMDVVTSDQHTVKPWFAGRVDVAPPVIDLTAQGFTLLGGRLDYIDGEPVASVVYQRRKHIINLFVGQRLGVKHPVVSDRTVQGYNIRRWSAQGLDYWAVSDLDQEELGEFAQKISAAVHPASPS
jgi:anti-sigma factor RsiW